MATAHPIEQHHSANLPMARTAFSRPTKWTVMLRTRWFARQARACTFHIMTQNNVAPASNPNEPTIAGSSGPPLNAT